MNIAKYALESFHGGAKEQHLGNNYVQRHHIASEKNLARVILEEFEKCFRMFCVWEEYF